MRLLAVLATAFVIFASGFVAGRAADDTADAPGTATFDDAYFSVTTDAIP